MRLIAIAALLLMLTSCSLPGPGDVRAACNTLFPLESNQQAVRALDGNNDGYVILNVPKTQPDGARLGFKNPVITGNRISTGTQYLSRREWNIQIVDYYILQSNGRKIFVSRSKNLVFLYSTIDGKFEIDCARTESIPVKIR